MRYDRHNAALTAYNNAGADDLDPETVDAAIALMRAAESKDESAEREHCIQAADQQYGLNAAGRADIIERERAAVRAECADELEQLKTALRDAREQLYCIHDAVHEATRLADVALDGDSPNDGAPPEVE